jgi:peptide/nickel transport system substrate-binding protein
MAAGEASSTRPHGSRSSHGTYLLDVGDPAGYLAADYACEGSYSVTQFCDEETDAQINQALQCEDQDARYEVYRELAQKVQSAALNVFLVHESGVVGATTSVENLDQHPLNFYVFTKDLSVS